MRRNHVVQSRMSDAEYVALCEKANSVERSISDYVRSSIALVQIHRIEQLSPLIEEMHHLGMELNGLTTKCHQGIMHHVDLTTIEAGWRKIVNELDIVRQEINFYEGCLIHIVDLKSCIREINMVGRNFEQLRILSREKSIEIPKLESVIALRRRALLEANVILKSVKEQEHDKNDPP